MALLLLKRSGVVKARCEGCGTLYAPGTRELKSIGKYGDAYAAICMDCVERQSGYSGKSVDRRRVYIPGGVISRWNHAAYEEYENSPEGIAERRAWEREMLAQVDEA